MSAQVYSLETAREVSMDDGFTRIANGLIEAITVASGLTAREIRILLAVVRNTYGYQMKTRRITENDLSNWTGIEAKNCGKLKRSLIAKNVLVQVGNEGGVNKDVAAWCDSDTAEKPARRGHTQPRTPKQNGVTGNPGTGLQTTPLGGYGQPRHGVTDNPPYKENSKETFKENFKDNIGPETAPICRSAERTPTAVKKSILDTVQEKHPLATVATRHGKAALWGEQVDEQLATTIATAVAEVTMDTKTPNIAAWANDIRLMRGDGRTPEQIAALFRFANTDDFWRSVILSPGKLRQKWGVLAARYNERRHQQTRAPKLDASAAGTMARLTDTSW